MYILKEFLLNLEAVIIDRYPFSIMYFFFMFYFLLQGVWFRKFYLIVWQGTVEVPEAVLRTVRLAVTAKDVEYARVRIAVLVFAVQEGIEYVVNVVSTKYIFSTDDNLLNLDDILPFDSLNDPPVSMYRFAYLSYIIG